MSHTGPGAGNGRAVREEEEEGAGGAGVAKRRSGNELEVRVEGAPSPKKQRRVREAELLEAEVGAPLAFNNICFACKSSSHWARECPFRSPSKRAVQTLVAARATCAEQGGHVANFACRRRQRFTSPAAAGTLTHPV